MFKFLVQALRYDVDDLAFETIEYIRDRGYHYSNNNCTFPVLSCIIIY